MRQKTAYAVFTLTNSGLDYMVKGNFGNDKPAANNWADFHKNDTGYTEWRCTPESEVPKYPHGLFVKEVKY
jgi:hypothetical protein